MALEPLVRDVMLRDGESLRLRAAGAGDADSVAAFFAALSERSRYLRFHGAVKPEEALVTAFLSPDWQERGSLLGTMQIAGEERVVALATWSRLRDPTTAEVAFAVADDLQGRGVGTRLLEQLVELAAPAGIHRFVAAVLAENIAMLSVFAESGFEVARELGGGVIEVSFAITATQQYREAVDRRDHEAIVSSLVPFFAPGSIAVLGASARPGSIGETVCRNIVQGGFAGPVHPVNRSGEAVAGLAAFKAVDEIPGPIDLTVICLPAEVVLAGAQAALAHGSTALCVISAGFAEVGAEGEARQEELLALVRGHGARLLGPNCLGIAVAGPRLNATFAPRSFPAGNIGFSSQSGALGLALLERSAARSLGFSSFVSVGNKADVSSNDLLEYWEDDPATDVVLLYLESFGNPRRFGRIAARVARRKPILAIKSGSTSSGARAASSHTAALAGSEQAVEALFHQAGVIRARTAAELVDVATLFSRHPAPAGNRVGIVTNAGGLGILCADACESAGLELPELSDETRHRLAEMLPPEASLGNPVDMLGSAGPESYRAALPIVASDPRIDGVIALFVPAATVTAEEVAAVLREHGGFGKPVLPVVIASETPAGMFSYPESAARALGRAVERSAWLRREAGAIPALAGIDPQTAEDVVSRAVATSDDAWLDSGETRSLLSAYGIPLVPEHVADGPDEAVEAAATLGLPVVVKTAEPGAHKSETGGVALNLDTTEKVRAAAARIGGSVLVQPMISGGAEFLAGVIQDPLFGPLVAFGPGGVFAELIGEAAFRIAPLTDVDADELVHTGKTGRLAAGFRGKPPSDSQALADLLLRLSRLAEELPSVSELDLNPVLGLPQGCLAVDARVRVTRAHPPARTKTW